MSTLSSGCSQSQQTQCLPNLVSQWESPHPFDLKKKERYCSILDLANRLFCWSQNNSGFCFILPSLRTPPPLISRFQAVSSTSSDLRSRTASRGSTRGATRARFDSFNLMNRTQCVYHASRDGDLKKRWFTLTDCPAKHGRKRGPKTDAAKVKIILDKNHFQMVARKEIIMNDNIQRKSLPNGDHNSCQLRKGV